MHGNNAVSPRVVSSKLALIFSSVLDVEPVEHFSLSNLSYASLGNPAAGGCKPGVNNRGSFEILHFAFSSANFEFLVFVISTGKAYNFMSRNTTNLCLPLHSYFLKKKIASHRSFLESRSKVLES